MREVTAWPAKKATGARWAHYENLPRSFIIIFFLIVAASYPHEWPSFVPNSSGRLSGEIHFFQVQFFSLLSWSLKYSRARVVGIDVFNSRATLRILLFFVVWISLELWGPPFCGFEETRVSRMWSSSFRSSRDRILCVMWKMNDGDIFPYVNFFSRWSLPLFFLIAWDWWTSASFIFHQHVSYSEIQFSPVNNLYVHFCPEPLENSVHSQILFGMTTNACIHLLVFFLLEQKEPLFLNRTSVDLFNLLSWNWNSYSLSSIHRL